MSLRSLLGDPITSRVLFTIVSTLLAQSVLSSDYKRQPVDGLSFGLWQAPILGKLPAMLFALNRTQTLLANSLFELGNVYGEYDREYYNWVESSEEIYV